jgi:hypothetical protein
MTPSDTQNAVIDSYYIITDIFEKYK